MNQRKSATSEEKSEFSVNPDDALSAIKTVKRDGKLYSDALDRLQQMHELARLIGIQRDSSELLDTILEAVKALVGADRCVVALCSPGAELQIHACRPRDLRSPDQRKSLSFSIMQRVRESGKAILSLDAMHEFPQQQSVMQHGIRSVLCAPLILDSEAMGVVYADNLGKVRGFNETDLGFLAALAGYIATALYHSHQNEIASELQSRAQRDLVGGYVLVGSAPAMQAALDRLRLVARKMVPVLLLGERGTGKELFARAVHRFSPRCEKTFLPVNIAALSSTLVESELFGHEADAFTDARRRRLGRFEIASGGSLFIDEVSEIPLPIQAKLLRVLESRVIERVGGNEEIPVDLRVICATNKNIEEEVRQGRFRADLLDRIQGVVVRVPALRERKSDIPSLIDHFLRCIPSTKRFDSGAAEALQSYDWPGNIRQLRRVVEEMDAVCANEVVSEHDLPDYIQGNIPSSSERFPTLREHRRQADRQHLRAALRAAGGNNEQARNLLAVGKETYFRIKRQCSNEA